MDWKIVMLSNGMPLVMKEKKDMYSVAAGIWVRSGSRYEKPSVSGISHFIEHMLFKGTIRRTTSDLKEAIEGKGGTFNAFTSEEFTAYYIKVLPRHLKTGLDVLSDMVQRPLLLSEEIEKERSVILEEIKMYYDSPARYVHDLFDSLMFAGNPLGMLISGSEKTVCAISRDDMVTWINEHYNAKNLCLSVCGKFDENRLVDWAEKYFGKVQNGVSSAFKPFSPSKKLYRVRVRRQKTEQINFCLGFLAPSRRSLDRYPLGVLSTILGGNMSSRLFNEVRENRGLAYDVRSYLKLYADTGSFVISAGLAPERFQECLRVVSDEINRIREVSVSDDELKRAKEYIFSQALMSLEDNLEYMLWIGEMVASGDPLVSIQKTKKRIAGVTKDDIRRVAKKLFTRENARLALIEERMGVKKATKILEECAVW
ncbi:MAG: pitrilysin family protein [Candidatus Ratteibacteria bacterium]|jgi:predicted Zn-dependent peptidase